MLSYIRVWSPAGGWLTVQVPPRCWVDLASGVDSQGHAEFDGVMLIVHVNVHVLADQVAAFIEATRANAAASRLEPGIARFDVVQALDEPTRIVLVEAYRSEQAALDHKETAHYANWRDAVEAMLAEPRTSVKFRDVDYPD